MFLGLLINAGIVLLFSQLPPELQSGVDLSAQITALSKFSLQGYQHKVTSKLKSCREYRHESDSQLAMISEVLSEHEKLREKYFSALVEGISKPAILESSGEYFPERKAMEKSIDRVSEFSVKLVVRPNPDRVQRFTTLLDQHVHSLASLQVGDVFLKWEGEGLVLPSFLDTKPRLKCDLNSENQWKVFVAQKQPAISSAVEELDQAKQVDVIVDLTTKKDHLLTDLIAVVAKYNRNKTHDNRRCNNYHFISEALKALEVKCPDYLNKSLRQYLKGLKKRKDSSIPSTFDSHAELDAHVMHRADVELLGAADVEYLLGVYFQFHLMDWSAGGGGRRWSCRCSSCVMATIV